MKEALIMLLLGSDTGALGLKTKDQKKEIAEDGEDMGSWRRGLVFSYIMCVDA